MKEPAFDYCADYATKIRRGLHSLARDYAWIGFLLDEMIQYGYLETGGYKNVYEYCSAEFGFKKSSVNNFLNIYRTFCYGPNPPVEHRGSFSCQVGRPFDLKEEWRNFNYSQLCEMLSLSERQRECVTPDMTVRKIREYKSADFQTSGKELSPEIENSDSSFNASRKLVCPCCGAVVWTADNVCLICADCDSLLISEIKKVC